MIRFWQLFLIGTVAVAMNGVQAASGLDAAAVVQAIEPIAQEAAPPQPAPTCPQEAALSRLIQHSIQPGETLDSLARRYNLLPTTLMAINPSLRKGMAPVGTKIVIPPYNGIVVALSPGQTLKDLAAAYPVRADVLFEVNGCQSAPALAFVPGVNWSPVASRGVQAAAPSRGTQYRYPLPAPAPLLLGYGWHVNPQSQRVEFHGGVDLQAAAGTPVRAAAAGTVAFAGSQGDYGNLVVVNHGGGYQTRYAQLETIAVRSGQQVQPVTRLGTVGATGKAQSPHLHFEIRLNSSIGWVAQDPARYISDIRF